MPQSNTPPVPASSLHLGRARIGLQPAGRHQIAFAAGNLASGLYLYRVEMGPYRAVRKMVVAR